MGNLKTDEDDDFITSASPETEPDEADAAFDAKEKKKKQIEMAELLDCTDRHYQRYYFNHMCLRFCICSSQACIYLS